MTPAPARAAATETLLEARHIHVDYTLRGGFLRRRSFVAVTDVSLRIGRGETVGLIGESGSGKSTLGRAILKLERSRGAILFEGRDLQPLTRDAMRPCRRALQIVFQDPFSSLSPRRTIAEIVGEGVAIHEPTVSRAERDRRVVRVLADVGLAERFLGRLPHELSGGQRQRVAIARAIILEPRLVVLDEPTSALDRSVQADVLALLRRLQAERDIAYLFITHDLAVVRSMAARIAVMKDGRIIESGPTEALMSAPREPYTKALLDAAITMT